MKGIRAHELQRIKPVERTAESEALVSGNFVHAETTEICKSERKQMKGDEKGFVQILN